MQAACYTACCIYLSELRDEDYISYLTHGIILCVCLLSRQPFRGGQTEEWMWVMINWRRNRLFICEGNPRAGSAIFKYTQTEYERLLCHGPPLAPCESLGNQLLLPPSVSLSLSLKCMAAEQKASLLQTLCTGFHVHLLGWNQFNCLQPS